MINKNIRYSQLILALLVSLLLQLGHLADAFIQSDLHRLIHTLTQRQQSQPCKARQEQLGLSVLLKDTSTQELGIELANLRLQDNCSTS